MYVLHISLNTQLDSGTQFKGDKSRVTKLVMDNVDLVKKFW